MKQTYKALNKKGVLMALWQDKRYIFSLILNIVFIINIPSFIYPRLDSRLITSKELLELALDAQKEETPSSFDLLETRSIHPKKSLTFMVYMAADNNLHYFAWKNIKQLEAIGSNNNMNIVVQINTPGYSNPTKRYLINSGKRILVLDEDSPNQKLNSGSPYTLIDFVKWSADHYPADEYALILWNHGSGDIDPNYARTINPCDLFYANPIDNKLEIDRGTGYITLLYQEALRNILSEGKRGICFDDTFKSYISNQDLEFALREICYNALGGQKLGILGFDACLMSMIGVASLAKPYAQYMVASQEVEYGTGWNYELALKPLLSKSLNPKELAKQLVIAYEQNYQKIINEYTQSALDLSKMEVLEQEIHKTAQLLIDALELQANHSVSDILRKCKSTKYCTCFDEPSYIDLGHFVQNLQQHIQHISLTDKTREISLQSELSTSLQNCLDLIPTIVIANCVGQKLKKAQGVSIYFPEHSISQNYLKSPFAQTNNWSYLLQKYINR